MHKKYDIYAFTEVLVWPTGTRFHGGADRPKTIIPDLVKLLGEGYEIYSAIAFSTKDYTGIQYILRREFQEQ